MNTLHSFALLVLTIIILAGYSAPEAYSQTSSRYLADAVPMMQCEGSAVRIANPFYRFTTKLTYKGDIKNDTATGNGTAVWMYGSDTIMVFTGEFLGGKMHGVGIAQYPLMGKVYKGKWQEGVPLGFFEKDSSPADRVFSPPPQSPAAEDVRNGEYIPTSGEFTALEIAPD
ncbi:MAG: hypothetical protein JNL32_03320, partial [Candidatus Kapabacteria bacterium]|nr:hypothetical protein [Candidatus Kapabacteria bacterium]